MAVSTLAIWGDRWRRMWLHIFGAIGIVLIYVASELAIWGFSLALAQGSLEYFASIAGMVVLFSAMTVVSHSTDGCERLYRRCIKAKVDFINSQLGLGFSVPIIMMDHSLGGRELGYIVSTFFITNIASWSACFLLCLLALAAIFFLREKLSVSSQGLRPSRVPSVSSQDEVKVLGGHSLELYRPHNTAGHGTQQTRPRTQVPSAHIKRRGTWDVLEQNCYTTISLVGLVAVGIPVILFCNDARALDGFTLWFSWIVSTRLQRDFKASSRMASWQKLKHSIATLMNPVLLTTALMFAYTRARAAVSADASLIGILSRLSSGSPVYTLLTALVKNMTPAGNPDKWFGAGDLALSLLECGILTWGFKLHECREQLFSLSGFVIALFCIVAAAGNVLLSTFIAGILGLGPPQALAFAARSTTLALAKPAIRTLGGDMALNATLVVSNGILGQLMYPLLLDKLSVMRDSSEDASRRSKRDNATTIAAGTAIGINGAAMGVSYLYEVKSRAAPYAALSMTMFGVMTVVFTTIEPFKGMVLGLSRR